MKILVTGGCGYIGSHTMLDLIENGFEAISVDNYSNSNKSVLNYMGEYLEKEVYNYPVDLCDIEALREVFAQEKNIQGVIHFAAFKNVGESVHYPIKYFHNNLVGLLNLLQVMQENNVNQLIFSSSCSVYGNAEILPVTEQTPWQKAESPYARTKQMGEDIITDFIIANPAFKVVILRYFNPAGAHYKAGIGENSKYAAENLVPIITETALGKRKKVIVYGNDYPTRDGSCIRDYIHIMDLASAHTKSIQYLEKHSNSENPEIFNLGIGTGVSVLEAIQAFEKATGEKLNYEIGPRRAGDVVAIYANNELAAQKLNWKPQRSILEIMKSAWEWQLLNTFRI
jgi:UDP-glucose 4-epimerase